LRKPTLRSVEPRIVRAINEMATSALEIERSCLRSKRLVDMSYRLA